MCHLNCILKRMDTPPGVVALLKTVLFPSEKEPVLKVKNSFPFSEGFGVQKSNQEVIFIFLVINGGTFTKFNLL